MRLTEEEYDSLVARRRAPGPANAFAALPVMTEAQLQRQIREVCKRLSLLHYHTARSDKSEPGFPDSVIVHPAGGTLFLCELKRDTERPTLAQQRWLDALARVSRVESGVVQQSTLASWVARFQRHADVHRGRTPHAKPCHAAAP